jgi:hypothetical protein
MEVKERLEEAVELTEAGACDSLSSATAVSLAQLSVRLAHLLATRPLRSGVAPSSIDSALDAASLASEAARSLGDAASLGNPRFPSFYPSSDSNDSSDNDEHDGDVSYFAGIHAHSIYNRASLSDQHDRPNLHRTRFDDTPDCSDGSGSPGSERRFPPESGQSPSALARKSWSNLRIGPHRSMETPFTPDSAELRSLKERNSSLQSEVLQLSRQLMTAQRRVEEEGIDEVDVLSSLVTRFLHADAESFNTASSLKSFFANKAEYVDNIPLSHKLPESTKEHVTIVKRELKEAAHSLPDAPEDSSPTAYYDPASGDQGEAADGQKEDDNVTSRYRKSNGTVTTDSSDDNIDDDDEELKDDFFEDFFNFKNRSERSSRRNEDENNDSYNDKNEPFGFARRGEQRRRWCEDGSCDGSEAHKANEKMDTNEYRREQHRGDRFAHRSQRNGERQSYLRDEEDDDDNEEEETEEMRGQKQKQEKLQKERDDLAQMLQAVESKFDGHTSERREALNGFLSKLIEDERNALSKRGGSLRSLFRRKALQYHPDKFDKKRFESLPSEVHETLEEVFKTITGHQER